MTEHGRLIDADKTIQWLRSLVDANTPTIERQLVEYAITVLLMAEDAEPIVRCTECKFWKAKASRCRKWHTHTIGAGFCYKGEREGSG